ncbi:RNaseH domain-containing protein, partial [Streptosporangium vulgare]|uniref:RNaseH domain-containing protein n=1 Tax=Streptosporangium vulgare TaxID=46190 RepID=UPI0031E170C0
MTAAPPRPRPSTRPKPGDPVLLRWETPELAVRLRCLPLSGGLADSLDIDPATRGRGRALAAAITARRAAVAAFLVADGADPDAAALALVEIDRRADFTTPAHDPKFALRLGCADAGVVTQFTAVPRKARGYNSEKNAAYRARSAWLDGLRQLGVRVVPEHTLGDRLPADLHYAAVWMVKRRADGPTRVARHTPVTVLVSPSKPGSRHAVIRGWDPEQRVWLPYPKFLLRLAGIAELPDMSDEIDEDCAPGASDETEEDPAPGTEMSPSPVGDGRPQPYVTFQERRRKGDEQRA